MVKPDGKKYFSSIFLVHILSLLFGTGTYNLGLGQLSRVQQPVSVVVRQANPKHAVHGYVRDIRQSLGAHPRQGCRSQVARG